MKAYIIVILSFAVLRSLAKMKEIYEEENGCGDFIAGVVFVCAHILALVFACLI